MRACSSGSRGDASLRAHAHGNVSALLDVARDEASVDERLLPREGASQEEANHPPLGPAAAAAINFSAAVAAVARIVVAGFMWGPQVGD